MITQDIVRRTIQHQRFEVKKIIPCIQYVISKESYAHEGGIIIQFKWKIAIKNQWLESRLDSTQHSVVTVYCDKSKS